MICAYLLFIFEITEANMENTVCAVDDLPYQHFPTNTMDMNYYNINLNVYKQL